MWYVVAAFVLGLIAGFAAGVWFVNSAIQSVIL